MKICPFVLLFHPSLAKEYFPDKTSVITNEHLAFYQREDFYIITVPCATAALFLICCVLCCTLYAREGVCHLFDFPDELRRHASEEHFLTVDEFLELERRHRLGLPVDSLLELQKKRRSEAGVGIRQSKTDDTAPQGDGDQLPTDTGIASAADINGLAGSPDQAPEDDAFDMSGQSTTKLASSVADMRPAQPQWSAPRVRRSMSLDHPIAVDVDGAGNRSDQDAAMQDTPASPSGSPMRYVTPSLHQDSEYPKRTPPGGPRDQDPAGQYGEGRPVTEPIPIPLSAAEEPKRIPMEDLRYPGEYHHPDRPVTEPIPIPLSAPDEPKRIPMEDLRYPGEYHRPSQLQDSAGADRGFLHRSDPELSHYAADRGYGAERAAGVPGGPVDDYNQWASRGRPLDGALPPTETHRRSLMTSPGDQREPGGMGRDRTDRSASATAFDRQGVDRHGAQVGGRGYSHQHPYGSESAAALGVRRASASDGMMLTPSGAIGYRGNYEPEALLSARDPVYPQIGGREDPQRGSRKDLQRGSREDLQRGGYPSPDPLSHQPEQPLQRRPSSQYEHSAAVDYPDEYRYGYPNQDLQRRTPSGRRLTYDGYDYHVPEPKYEHIPIDAPTHIYESREALGLQRHASETRGIPRQQRYESPKQGLQYEQPITRITSRAYDNVDQGFPPHSDAIGQGYRRGESSPRVPSQLSLSRNRPSRSFAPEIDATDFGRRLDGRAPSGERGMVDPSGRPVSSAADMRGGRTDLPLSDYTGRSTAMGADVAGSRQWITAADGRQYLVAVASRQSVTAPLTPRHWSEMQSSQMEFRTEGPEASRIFGPTTMPVGIYGEAVDMMDVDRSENTGRHAQQVYEDRAAEDPRRPESGWREVDEDRAAEDPRRPGSGWREVDGEKRAVADQYDRRREDGRAEEPSVRRSGLMQRVRSVSVSRMSHSLRQMVARGRRPSCRSLSEEPRDLSVDGLRGSAAWLLHRIRSLRGVSEQPAAGSRSSERRQKERRADRRSRSHRHKDSPTGSDGGVSGAAVWPSSEEDLEEGEYVSPSHRDRDEQVRHPTPQLDGQMEVKTEEGLTTELYKQCPQQVVESETLAPSENAVSERQPSPEQEPVQYVLEEHAGRKRIIAVSADLSGVDQYPPSKALEVPTVDKRATSDLSDQSKEETPRKKSHKKRRDKSGAKYQRSEDSVNGQSKRKKAKSKKKKKKHSRKRSRSSRSTSSSSSSSFEGSTKNSKRRRASLCRDSEQRDSDESEYTDESTDRPYDDRETTTEANSRHLSRSASRESHLSAEQRRYQGQRNNRFSERTNYGQQTWRPRPNNYQQRYQPRQSPAAVRSRWDSGSPAPGSLGRSQTPPDREPTPDRGRSELNRHGQPRHRPVVFQNESLRAFVSQPSRRTLEQRGRPPRTGRGGVLPATLRRPFQTNQSFIPSPWQQNPDSPQRGRARGTPPGRPGPRTPPPPAPSPPAPAPPRQGVPDRLSPSTTPPRPPPRTSPVSMDPRTRPARGDPRLCARNQIARAAAARECQMRRAVYGQTSQEDVGCATKLKRLFDE